MVPRDTNELVFNPDPQPTDERAYNQDGVDLTLIRKMLAMTPIERLRYMESHSRSITRLPAYAARAGF